MIRKHHHLAAFQIVVLASMVAWAVFHNRVAYHGWWVWPDVLGASAVALVGLYGVLHAFAEHVAQAVTDLHEHSA